MNSDTIKFFNKACWTHYHIISQIVLSTNTDKFEVLLHQTVKELNRSSITASFGKYFDAHYVQTKEQWAACYRKDAYVNTNMYVEGSLSLGTKICVHERKR